MIITLSTNTIARVVVNAVRSSASASAFDNGLILAPCASFTEEKRLLTFASATEAAAGLISAGFTAADEAYKAALKYFGASLRRPLPPWPRLCRKPPASTASSRPALRTRPRCWPLTRRSAPLSIR